MILQSIICFLFTRADYCTFNNDTSITSSSSSSARWNLSVIEDGNCISQYRNRNNEIEIFQHNLTCRVNEDCYDPTMICPEGSNICVCASFHVWVPKYCTCIADLKEIHRSLHFGENPDGAVLKIVGPTLYKWLVYDQDNESGFLNYIKFTWPIMLSVIFIIILYTIIYII